jgi:hypothetical protein
MTNYTEIVDDGAFEIFVDPEVKNASEVYEHLTTLTRNGELMKPGDELPFTPEGTEGRPYLLHIVNQVGTPRCEECIDTLETLIQKHPEVPVVTLTKEFDKDAPKERKLGQRVLQIGREAAIDLGVELVPGQDADPEFWLTALRRTLAAVDADGRVLYVEQPLDQDQMLDFDTAYAAIETVQ